MSLAFAASKCEVLLHLGHFHTTRVSFSFAFTPINGAASLLYIPFSNKMEYLSFGLHIFLDNASA